jgi:hypothetical protein
VRADKEAQEYAESAVDRIDAGEPSALEPPTVSRSRGDEKPQKVGLTTVLAPVHDGFYRG